MIQYKQPSKKKILFYTSFHEERIAITFDTKVAKATSNNALKKATGM